MKLITEEALKLLQTNGMKSARDRTTILIRW